MSSSITGRIASRKACGGGRCVAHSTRTAPRPLPSVRRGKRSGALRVQSPGMRTTSLVGGRGLEISLVPSAELRRFLDSATKAYYETLRDSPAVDYLRSRGLSGVSAQSFHLGYVANPLAGHEQYVGRLAIPYLTQAGTVSIRFRKLPDADGPKYLSVSGDEPRLFNGADLSRRERYVCITEGEIDAITAHQCGLPAVGVPGVNGWRPWMARAFKGYAAVYILCDNDDKGQGREFGERVAAQIPVARVVVMPEGHDVNSYVVAEGEAALREKLGIDAQ